MPEEKNNNNNRVGRYIAYAMAALAVVLLALMVGLVMNYRSLRRSTAAGERASWLMAFLHNHGPLTAADVNYVRPWMTFDYLNKLFNLPPDYLKTQLRVTDPRYPRLTLSEYVEHDHLDLALFMKDLDGALNSYLTVAPTSTPH